jgi:P-type Ca2+ transporter type 2C
LALVPPLLGWPLLLLPAEIVWIELLIHPTSSLVFPFEPPPPDLMTQPPRPATSGFFAPGQVRHAVLAGLAASAVSLVSYRAGLALSPEDARSQSLVTLLFCFALLVLAGRWKSLFGPRRNRALPAVAAGTLATLPLAFAIPWLRATLGLTVISTNRFLLAVSLAAVFGIVERLLRAAALRRGRGEDASRESGRGPFA